MSCESPALHLNNFIKYPVDSFIFFLNIENLNIFNFFCNLIFKFFTIGLKGIRVKFKFKLQIPSRSLMRKI